ncbi:outer membrane efflux protein [Salinisphaera dokdonensis CL-ES53]|uniref:Outer membrane efflux protein n=1 Tax=Salinisphaera dokdonensis CL-ES53 TaxID=1304272 RepID=A0ABV2B484_9GAMM
MAISPLAEALPLSKPVPTRLGLAVSFFTFLLLAISSVIGSASAFAQDRQPSTKHFDVEELVDTVLRQNAGIQALQASVFAAEARVTPAGSLSDPRLSAAVAPETLDGLDTPAGRTRGPNVRVEISQEIPWPGTLGLRADAARKDAQAASQDVASLRLRLAAATRTLYADWRYVHRALEINNANQKLLEDLYDVAESRYAAGLGRQHDLLQAAVQRQRLKHQAIKLQRLQSDVRAKINRLMTRSPNAALAPPPALPALGKTRTYDVLRKEAMSSHPVLVRIEKEIAAHKDREALARKAFYPDFKVFGGYNSLWDAAEKRWVVGVGLSLPLDRGKYRAQLNEARAQLMQREFELKDQRSELLSALKRAYAAAEEAEHTINLYEGKLAPLARANLSAARAAYGAGDGSFLDVVTAEEKQLEVDLNLERARTDYFSARAQIARWSGTHMNATHSDTRFNLDMFFQ